jgi:hypothetical protein
MRLSDGQAKVTHASKPRAAWRQFPCRADAWSACERNLFRNADDFRHGTESLGAFPVTYESVEAR